MAVKRPRIGITMRIELETQRFYLGRHYSEAVAAVGGVPVHLSLLPERDYLSAALDELDGILLPGSDSDVDPLRYGREPHPQLGTVQPLKDETDWLVLQEVEKRGTPLLGICYGMQALNVARGGTLIQDLACERPLAIKHQQGVPRDRPSHRLRLEPDSLIARLGEHSRAVVNSHHHQAVEEVGAHLRATAWTADGIIEAIEDTRPERYALAVQWHPELGWEHDAFSRAIFQSFVVAAGDFAASRGLSQTSANLARAG